MFKGVIADFGEPWVLTNKDIEFSYYRHRYERNLVGLRTPLTKDAFFPAFQYVMLSAAQNTKKLVKTFNKLSRYRLNTPENVLKPENHDVIVRILSETRFPNEKTKRFFGLAEWWQENPVKNDFVIDEIVRDLNSGKKNTIHLRDRLDSDGPKGIGPKSASLLIQLATEDIRNVEVVTVDKWMLQFLKDIGYKQVKVPDYRTISGISPKEYREYEAIISEKARQHSLSPGELGYALWCKSSYTEPNRCLDDFF